MIWLLFIIASFVLIAIAREVSKKEKEKYGNKYTLKHLLGLDDDEE